MEENSLCEWPLREKLALASAVMHANRNWNQVAKLIRPLCLRDNPEEIITAKTSAQQYSKLLESFEKRRSEKHVDGTSSSYTCDDDEAIVKYLTIERLDELQLEIKNDHEEYNNVKRQIEDVISGKSDDHLSEIIEKLKQEEEAFHGSEDIVPLTESEYEEIHRTHTSFPSKVAHSPELSDLESKAVISSHDLLNISSDKSDICWEWQKEASEWAGQGEGDSIMRSVSSTKTTNKSCPSTSTILQDPLGSKRFSSAEWPSEKSGYEPQELTSGSSGPTTITYTGGVSSNPKSFKQFISMLLRSILMHRHASIFANPVTDDIAPGYSDIVRQPMDLTCIRRRVDRHQITSTLELKHDLMLMFTNAVMYNNKEHYVHQAAQDMYQDVMSQIEVFEATQQVMFEGKHLRTQSARRSLEIK